MIKTKPILLLLFMVFLWIRCVSPGMNNAYKSHEREHQKYESILRKTESENRTISAKNMLSHLRMFLGVPYRAGGTNLRGVDCSGFVQTIFLQAAKIELPHNAAEMFVTTSPISDKQIQFGDLLFFENYKDQGISHVGIYLSGAKFIHSSISNGVIISSLAEKYYKQRFKGVRRVANFHLK